MSYNNIYKSIIVDTTDPPTNDIVERLEADAGQWEDIGPSPGDAAFNTIILEREAAQVIRQLRIEASRDGAALARALIASVEACLSRQSETEKS